MQEPLRIAFRGMEPPIGVEETIHQRVAELERFCDRITGCSVVLESRHQRHHQGKLYQVRIDLVVPGREIVAGRDAGANHAHEDLHIALRDSFNAARRQLQDYAREMRGDVKQHAGPPVGQIVRLMPEADYGFLVTDAGDEIYLQRNAVLGRGFDQLRVGDRVRYAVHEQEGEHGPQASTVVPL